MNAKRREVIANILRNVDALRSELEEVANQEREYFDNMPEAIQQGEKGEKAESDATALEQAVSALEEAVSEMEGIE